jgi:hypothetical protein
VTRTAALNGRRGGEREEDIKQWLTSDTGVYLSINVLANSHKRFPFLILLRTTLLQAIIHLKISITSFASHSASAYLLEETDEVSCSFRPCLREDVPLEVPCAILVQNIWSSLGQVYLLHNLLMCERTYDNNKLNSIIRNMKHNKTCQPLYTT